MKTQDDLYQEFLASTAQLRAEFEAKVKALREELDVFRKPFDTQFDTDTAEIKALIDPEVAEIDRQHRYACHNAALPFHRKIDKLEKERLKKMKPLQTKWDALTADHQKALSEAVNPKLAEFNSLIEKMTEEFNEANKPAHEAYLAEAAALERQILNTPVAVAS